LKLTIDRDAYYGVLDLATGRSGTRGQAIVGWAPGGPRLVFEASTRSGKLGDVMCRLVRIKLITD